MSTQHNWIKNQNIYLFDHRKKKDRIMLPSNYQLFADFEKVLQRNRFDSNEEGIAAIEAYFEAKKKSLYKHDIKS